MENLILPAVLSAAGIVALLLRLDILKVAGYHVPVDIIVSLSLAALFAGTYSGVVVALLAGLFLSAVFEVVRYFFGYKRLVMTSRGLKWKWIPTAK